MEKTAYQERIHLQQKALMGRYYDELTAAAKGGEGKAVYMLISGNPIELVRAFDLLPVYPEVNALQLAAKKQSLPLIQRAEEVGYSVDNCGYVKADVGLYFSGGVTSFGTIPPPALILCNYVGCNVYLQWFEHLAEYTGAETYNLDIPFVRDPEWRILPKDVEYVVRQLEEVIEICERITGRPLDWKKLRQILARSAETEELWSAIKDLTRNVPSPFDAYFDAATMMGPLYCLRGSQECVEFFRMAHAELEAKVREGTGPLPKERFRTVIEGPPPWPYFRSFRDLFSRWGAVCVASTYSTVGGVWEFGFRHDPQRPLESIAEHMLFWNVTNRNFLQRYDQLRQYVEGWQADALVIHSIKSCRLFSAGQGDMREYFSKELGVPTLLVESDLEDPRYYSEAQMRNRVDAFFESLEHRKLTAVRQGG
ncbi:MAG: 2-hydroxyacyl-CoA dehydratase [Deltaproteobacteria bacterium]|nr:2-hydroxyacyl-CoA dehydratase [Deltaproteobacteria bacterium]MBI3075495.1 2-hydroxyacyl-CoA dehydratase [Deltaproteobacteria bacterium]